MKSLNHIYRTIWSEALGAWVAVSEIAKAKGKRSVSSLIRAIQIINFAATPNTTRGAALKPILFALICCLALDARANPVGGDVVSGQATFNSVGNTLTVTNTPGTIINWQGFSINANEVTHFAQQSAASTVLNRVVTNAPSIILGKLSSNGRVFLVNANGIMFGAGSTVDVAGLVATTLNLSDADFLAGRNNFTAVSGAQNISNAGNITAQQGGQIYLIAPNVENNGIITAPNGEILLAAGHSVELVNTNDPALRVNITAGAGEATNLGQLIVQSGSLGLFGAVVKNSGLVSADSATLQGGKIVFKATQRVDAGGTISAQGAGGGEIKVLADMQDGTVNVTGILNASAPDSGNGGFIETSAAHVQVADSARVTTLAAHGINGTWLIDPTDFTVAASGGDMTGAAVASALAGGNFIIQTVATGGGNGDIFVNDAISWANANSLTLQAIRNVEISAPISNSSSGNLVVRADMNGTSIGTIDIGEGGSISLNSGRADLYYNPSSYNNPTDYSSHITGTYTAWMLVNDVDQLQDINSNLSGDYALGKNIDASATSGWDGGEGFMPIGTYGYAFTGKFDGLGNSISNLTIDRTGMNYVGLFGYASNAVLTNVALKDSSITGNTVVGGLLGGSDGSTISNSSVENSSVFSYYYEIGGLVGENNGTITNSYVKDVTVSGYSDVGGLVGYNDPDGVITSSYATNATVFGGSGADIGGLVGGNEGTISFSHSSGSVSGTSKVGGLVGGNYSATISDSFSSATVNDTSDGGEGRTGSSFGGLVGYAEYSTIERSYATGDTGGSQSQNVGGLVGYNNSGTSIIDSYASGAVSGAFQIGGLIGANYGASTANSYYDIDNVLINGGHYVTEWGIYHSQYQDWTNGSHVALNATTYLGATVGGYYQIGSLQKLKDMLAFVEDGANQFKLTANLDLSTLPDWHLPALFGEFNGNGFVLNNLSVNQSFNNDIGFVGYLASGATVQNLGLTNASVTGHGSVGGLVGYSRGNVSNSYVSNSVIMGYSNGVGGLVGYNLGSVDGSYVSGGSVSGSYNIGGLVGYDAGEGGVSNSYVSGVDVSGSGSIGGLVGYNQGSISNSYATGGSVNSYYEDVGGLVGYNNGQISDSYVIGANVTGSSSDVGGLVGYNQGTISNSYVSGGTVSGQYQVGGLVGYDGGEGSIDKSYVILGTVVTGEYSIGGLAGQNNGNITRSYVDGANVTGSSSVGGLVGYNQGSISNSYVNGGFVSGTSRIGGLVGENDYGTISGSYVSGGSVSGTYAVGGLVGYNYYGTVSNDYVSGVALSVDGGEGGHFIGGLVGQNDHGTVSDSYASVASLTGGTIVGGVVGYNTMDSYGGEVSSNFWENKGTGFIYGIGGGSNGGSDSGALGLDATGLMTMSNFVSAGWDIAGTGGAGSTWRIYDGYTMPLLTSFLKQLTVTANDATKTYDGVAYSGGNGITCSATACPGGVLTNLFNTSAYTGTSQGAVNAGSYTLTSAAYSNQQGYDITAVDGTLTVSPVVVSLSIGANNATKTYGTTLSFDGTEFHVVSGSFIGSDNISSVTLTSTGAVNTANAGSYSIVVTPGSETWGVGNASNYSISYVNGVLTVNPAALTVTATAGSKIYGNVDPTLTYSTSGLLFSDALTGSLTRVAGENVGSYAINQGTLANSNYTITYVGNNLAITPRNITITVNPGLTKTYGSADNLTFTVGGLGLASSDTNAAVASAVTRTAGENVGTYGITQGALTNANYNVTSFTGNTLTITPALLTIIANALSKFKDAADPTLTYTVNGLKFADTAAATLSGVLDRVAGEDTGSYAINQGSLLVSSSNYTLASFTPGTLSIVDLPVITPPVLSQLVGSTTIAPPSGDDGNKKKEPTVVADNGTTKPTGTQNTPGLVCQ